MICLAIWCYEFLIVYLLQLCILCITKNILNKQNIYFFSTFGIETFRDGNFGFKADFQYGLPALLAGHMTAWVFYDCSLAETNIAQLILHFHNLESGIVVYELSEIRLLLTNQIIYNLAFPIASFQQHNTPMSLHCCFLLDVLYLLIKTIHNISLIHFLVMILIDIILIALLIVFINVLLNLTLNGHLFFILIFLDICL
jgi:hypothetical protein